MVVQFICHKHAVDDRLFQNTYQKVFNASMKGTHPETEKMKPMSMNTRFLYNFIIIFIHKVQTNQPVFSITVCFDCDVSYGLVTT